MSRPPLPDIPMQADEAEMLNAFLDYYRADLLDRAWGLDHAQLQIALPPSTLTMSRIIGHMAMVESNWFRVRWAGLVHAEPFGSLDFDADRDAEMTQAQALSIDELHAQFEAAVADSRSRVEAASSLDDLSAGERDGEHWSLRWILVHMIEEYARHCGHADFIRESIDGDLAR